MNNPLSKLQSEAVKEFEKQDFCFEEFDGGRCIKKLHTNYDTTPEVKQFLSDQIQKAVEETRKEDINFLKLNRWSNVVDGWCNRINEPITLLDLEHLSIQKGK